jgi:PAS domain S-box-containing protein
MPESETSAPVRDSPARGSSGAESSGADSNEIDILLVDDRDENLLTLEAVLASPDYNLVRATSGADALKYLLHNDPAIILLDVQMPELDGFETAAIIKKNERTREIPIIFLTAINKDERFVHKGYDHGAVDYLYKPFDAHILKSKVAVFAELYRKTKTLVRMEQQLRIAEVQERARRIEELELRHLRRERTSQKKYRDLIEGIDHGMVWIADPELLNCTFVSQSAERILGYPLNQWSEEPGFLVRHLHEDDRNRFLYALHQAREGDREVGLDHRMIGPRGEQVWLHTGLRRSRDGERSEVRGLSVDISEVKRAEEMMRKSKQRSEFAAAASLVLSETLDSDAVLTRIGDLAVPRLADWYGIDVVDESGKIKSLSLIRRDAGPPQRGEQIAAALGQAGGEHWGVRQVVQSGRTEFYSAGSRATLGNESEYEARLAAVKQVGLRSLMIVPLMARGQILGALSFGTLDAGSSYDEIDLAMAEDLARRASAAIDNANLYKQAQSAIRARDEFLSIASHELRTPLTPLKLQTQGLMRTLKSKSLTEVKPEKITKMLETSDRQISRLSKLIDDLLDLSRISIGRLSLSLDDFDFPDLVRETVERFHQQLADANCDLVLDCPDKLTVHWDRFRIEQVIINLLVNAIKYGPGKPIHVKVEEVGTCVRFSVRDGGIGIAPEDQLRIFGRFERAVSGTHFGGLGLGLYIVTQILSAHGGKIGVTSRLGAGSTFKVEIPKEPSASNLQGSALTASESVA